MIRLLAILALALSTSSCEALVPYHRFSAEYDGERTAIVLDTVDVAHASAVVAVVPKDGEQLAFTRDPLDFEIHLDALVAGAAAASSRAPSAWGAKTAGTFYAAPPRILDASARGERGQLVELKPGVRGFRIERWLEDERVSTIEFSMEFVDGGFRVTLERISMPYSRAKVADESWRNWWARIPCVYGFWFDLEAIFGSSYGDQSVDVQVDLEFTSSSTDENGAHRFAPIAVLGWTVLDVKLGGTTRVVGQSSGWVPLVPPSVVDAASSDHRYGQGRFSLGAMVVEQDDLAPKFIADRESLGAFVDDIMSFLRVPGLVAPVP